MTFPRDFDKDRLSLDLARPVPRVECWTLPRPKRAPKILPPRTLRARPVHFSLGVARPVDYSPWVRVCEFLI
jgi:hypothetical protein